jgi:hypothetical protein
MADSAELMRCHGRTQTVMRKDDPRIFSRDEPSQVPEFRWVWDVDRHRWITGEERYDGLAEAEHIDGLVSPSVSVPPAG